MTNSVAEVIYTGAKQDNAVGIGDHHQRTTETTSARAWFMLMRSARSGRSKNVRNAE